MAFRLSAFYFVQFAVWGCYLTSLGQYLGSAGLGRMISWFYAAAGIVSLVMPALMGHISDRYVGPRRLLALSHGVAALFMGGAWWYAAHTPAPAFWPLFLLYLGFLSFFLPTIALANASVFSALASRGESALDKFPVIRIWGTVGFVAAMWLVNSFYWHEGAFGFTLSEASPFSRWRLQYTSGQLLASAITGVAAAVLSLMLPEGRVREALREERRGRLEVTGLGRFRLFADRRLRGFLIFAVLGGVCLQISNGYVTPYITQFGADPAYSGSAAASNATMLFSISQIAEALCVLGVGYMMRRFGAVAVLGMALAAWGIRFGTLALGNPGDGLWLLVLSMVAYGVAFDFFNIAGALYLDSLTPQGGKGFGQGVLMLMSNGLGATLGMICAGGVVNHYCHWEQSAVGQRYFVGDWTTVWSIFAIYSLTVGLMLILCLRRHRK